MKKIGYTALLALLLTAVLLLLGCDLLKEPFPGEGDESTEIEGTLRPVVPAETLSPADREIADLAAEALWAEHDLPDREHFRVEVTHGSNGNSNIYVDFELYIGGYRTWESYGVTLNARREVTGISGGYENYRRFLEGATPEAVAAAEAALAEQWKPYGEHSGSYLSIDNEGYLCLSCEVIVELDPPFWEQEGGCGIDHEHKFFHERICSAP